MFLLSGVFFSKISTGPFSNHIWVSSQCLIWRQLFLATLLKLVPLLHTISLFFFIDIIMKNTFIYWLVVSCTRLSMCKCMPNPQKGKPQHTQPFEIEAYLHFTELHFIALCKYCFFTYWRFFETLHQASLLVLFFQWQNFTSVSLMCG